MVNNAGLLVFKDFENQTLDDWNFVLNTNLTSAFLLSQAVVPYMKKQHYGKIVFISSLAAIRGVGGAVAYSASKAGEAIMKPEEIANAAVYLASEDSRTVHGLDLIVDAAHLPYNELSRLQKIFYYSSPHVDLFSE